MQSFERFYMPVRTVAAIRYASHKKQGLKLYFDGRRVEPLEPVDLLEKLRDLKLFSIIHRFQRFYTPAARFWTGSRPVLAVLHACHQKRATDSVFDSRRGETAPTIILGGLGFLGLGDSYGEIIFSI